jgi:hypothetical protein
VAVPCCIFVRFLVFCVVFDLGSHDAISVKQLADPCLGIENVLSLSRFLVSTKDDANEDTILNCIDSIHNYAVSAVCCLYVCLCVCTIVSVLLFFRIQLQLGILMLPCRLLLHTRNATLICVHYVWVSS